MTVSITYIQWRKCNVNVLDPLAYVHYRGRTRRGLPLLVVVNIIAIRLGKQPKKRTMHFEWKDHRSCSCMWVLVNNCVYESIGGWCRRTKNMGNYHLSGTRILYYIYLVLLIEGNKEYVCVDYIVGDFGYTYKKK